MKRFNILLVFLVVCSVCYGQKKHEELQKSNTNGNEGPYSSFGSEIEAQGAISYDEMYGKYRNMEVNDSLEVKFSGTVTEVCKVKGCWMTLELEDDAVTMVRFKDYGFFVPKDISGKEVVVSGQAFVEEMSVEDQKHYAKDGGASQTEIEKITEPKKIYGFEAIGVLLKN